MKKLLLLTFLVFAAATLLSASPVQAEYTITGDVSPTVSTDWTNSVEAYIGKTADGTLTIYGGDSLLSRHAILGFYSGVSGIATVDGSGTAWDIGSQICVGFDGIGELNITNGGAVNTNIATIGFNTGSTGTLTVDGADSALSLGSALYVGSSGSGTLNITNGSTVTAVGETTIGDLGKIDFGDNGGTLTTPKINGSTSQITGTGTIVTRSWLGGDFDLVADSVTPTTQTVDNVTGDSRDITVKLDISDTSSAPLGELSIGYQGSGSLTIKDGITFASTTNYVGYLSGSTGTVSVDGSGSTWNAGTVLYLGYGGTGAVSVTNGATLTSTTTHLGYDTGSSGSLTLDGAGTTWNNSGKLTVGASGSGEVNITNGVSVSSASLYVGDSGNGLFNISSGSAVTSGSSSYIGYDAGSTGAVTVDGAGSTLNAGTNLYIGRSGSGSLAITGGGSVDTTSKTFLGYNAGSEGSVIVDGAGSTWTTGTLGLYVGYNGSTADIAITNGASLTSNWLVFLGYYYGASGSAVVDGEGSTWAMNNGFYIGYNGTGNLSITDGAAVSNTFAYLGANASYTGTAKVDGTDSTWTNTGSLYVGNNGTGALSISDGGAVTASSTSINSSSILTTDLGYGSSLTVGSGSGTITNNGTLRLVAGAGAASGTYSPMSYDTLSGNDAQALGGVWDAENHTVTVYDAATASAGEEKTIDLFATQRILITDEATGQRVGASFMTADSSTSLTFTADLMGESELGALEGILASGEVLLTGWDFEITGIGYAEGDPVYLSLEIGSGYDLSALALWYYDGSAWSEYIAGDLAYDETYASFTVTDFSGYAVTASTAHAPIPGAVWLLGSGLAGLGFVRRTRSRGKA